MAAGAVLADDDPVFELGQGDVAYPLYDEFDREVSVALGEWNAASGRLVALTRRAIAEGWWRAAGCVDPEHWLRSRCGLEAAHARRVAATARELGDYPTVAAQLAAGRITADHAHAIVSCVDPAVERSMAETAPAWTVAQIRRYSANFPKPRPEPEQEKRSRTGTRSTCCASDGTTGAASWADALERLAHAGLGGLDPDTAAGQRPSDRYQVLVHVDLDRLSGSRLHLGPTLTNAQRRLLTCDADIRAVLWEGGRPVGLGWRRRVADAPLRALVEDRDRGCRHCGARGFLHIHHLVHWEDHGPTDPSNLVALCTACHRDIHAGRLTTTGDPSTPDGLVFLDGTGRPLPTPTASPPGPEPPGHLRRAKPYTGPHRGRRMPRGTYRT